MTSDIPPIEDEECRFDPHPDAKKCNNDKQYYFSASSFKQIDDDNKEYVKRSELFEYGVDTQCSMAKCGTQKSLKDGRTKCYICGYPILSSKGHFRKNPDGSQCEHVLTATTIAMLCGLSNEEYDKVIEEIDSKVQGSLGLGESSELLTEFIAFREKLLREGNEAAAPEGGGNNGTVYKWSHPACNLIKNEYPFLKINFTDGGPIIQEPEGCDSIKYVLQMLWCSKDNRAIEWRKKFDPENSTGDLYCYDEEIQKWVLGRMETINLNTIQPIKDIINDYDKDKLSKYSGIAMHVLCEIITSKLLKSSIFKALTVKLKLKDNFKKNIKHFL